MMIAALVMVLVAFFIGRATTTNDYYEGYWKGKMGRSERVRVELTKPHDRSIKPYEVLWRYHGTWMHLKYYETEAACHDAIRDFRKASSIFNETTFRHRDSEQIAADIVKSVKSRVFVVNQGV